MKTILAILLCLPLWIMAQVPPPAPASAQDVTDGTATYKFISPYTLAQAGITGGGGGAAVSNAVGITFATETRYTNDTAYYAEVSAAINLSQVGGAIATLTYYQDINLDGTSDFNRSYSMTMASGTHLLNPVMREIVPPGAAYAFTNASGGGSIASFVAAKGAVTYYSTNTGGGGGSGDVTQSGLAAGSYGVFGSTNVLGAGTPAKVIATNGLTTVHFETNSVVFGNKNRTNANIHVKDGALWLPNATSDYGAVDGNQYAGNLIWRGLNGTNNNAPLADNAIGDGFAKIAAYYYWGGTPDPQTQPGNPSLLITAPKLRLEEGYTYQLGDYAGEVSVGNEDHFGMVNINAVPIDNAGVNVDGLLGRSHALGFRVYNDTLATGGTTKHQSLPGIQARGLPVASAPYSEDYSTFRYYAGELDFYSVVPLPRNGDPSTVWDSAPGLKTATMHSNSWEFFGSVVVTNGSFSVQAGSTNYDWMIFTNGTLALPAYNTSETSIERGISFFNTNGQTASRIITWADHAGGNTPEMMIESTSGIALKPGAINIGASSVRPFIQLGHNANAYGAYTFMSYGPAGIADGIANSLTGSGHSSSLNFRMIGTNGGGSYIYADAGIMGAAGGDQSAVYGPGGDQYGRGKLGFYTVAPIFNGGSYSSYPGIMVFEMGTNNLAMQGTNQFIGNGAGVTNQNYALFSQVFASGATHPTFALNVWTNVAWTTNNGTMSFDSGSAFTLSNHMIIVNSAGAGRWRVRGNVPIRNNSPGGGNVQTRLYRGNNTPGTVVQGQALYTYYYNTVTASTVGVVTFAAGDVFALQALCASDFTIGNPSGANQDDHVGAILELERQ